MRRWFMHSAVWNVELVVRAYTKSEARALFKKALSIRPRGRLPVGIDIVRGELV